MIHHLALAPKDFARAHAFYTEAMGFPVVKVVKRQTPVGGWSRHVFYDTGDGGLFALWDLHLDGLADDDWESAISTGLGLPVWVNHFAFQCADRAALDAHRQRWLDHGLVVSEVDHEFIRSIYTRDPDGNVVEWTCVVRPLDETDRIEAERLLADDEPATEPDYDVIVHRPLATAPGR
jgi:catechol 2,3-dioxygenase-like lactoylglutathione lyase family enzyme